MNKAVVIINSLLSAAGAGSLVFLILAVGFRMDYIKALLLADLAAFLVLMVNPLWLGCDRDRARKGRGRQRAADRQGKELRRWK